MDASSIKETLAGIAGLLAAVFAGLKWLLPFIRDARKKRAIMDGLRTLHVVYLAMERLQAAGATRVAIFAGHNCGGVPRIGKNFYTSALHWILAEGQTDRIGDYSNIEVDAAYIRMLLQLEQDGVYHFDPEREPDCFLRRCYRAEGVRDAHVFYLGTEDNAFLYLSACHHHRQFDPSEVTDMGLIVQTIRQALSP